MSTAIPIELSTWPRRETFEHYRNAVPCSYTITVEMDETAFASALSGSSRKSYVAQIWALATVVNRHDEFKMCLDGSGQPAVWPIVHPMFTVFNPERETFASVWVPYDPDFSVFHAAAARLLTEHRAATTLFPQGELPANAFDVSSLPWSTFTGFTLNIRDSWDHLAPIFTLGRYVERDAAVIMPLAVQVHHAAADGFHTTRLINEFQALMAEPSWVTQPPVAE